MKYLIQYPTLIVAFLFLTASSLFAVEPNKEDANVEKDNSMVSLEVSAKELEAILHKMVELGSVAGQEAYGIDIKKEFHSAKKDDSTNIQGNNDIGPLNDIVSESNESMNGAVNVLSKMMKQDLEQMKKSGANTTSLSIQSPQRVEAELLNGKGTISAMFGDLDGAIESYKKAIETDPNYPSAYYNFACALALKNDAPAASKLLNKAITFDRKYIAMAKQDKDFDQIRENNEFKALLNR